MTTVLSDRETVIVHHLVENELMTIAEGRHHRDEEYRGELTDLQAKLEG